MVFIIKRREADHSRRRRGGDGDGPLGQRPERSRRPTRRHPSSDIEKGASLRILRPARFVEPDEVIFRANTAKFAKENGVEVRVDFVGWEDIRQQTAVSANTGAGPDIVLGWAEDPHIYSDKLLEVTDVAEYLGKKYGGWMFLGEKYGKKRQDQQLDRPAVRRHRAARSSIASRPSRPPASTRCRAITPTS